MGVINDAHIPEHQFRLLVGLLTQLPSQSQNYNLVKNIARSTEINNDILVIKGVHYQQFDSNGQFHFNIRIRNRGRYDPSEHHVYVEPELVSVGPDKINIDPNGSVTLATGQCMMIYTLVGIPTLMY